MGKHKWARTKRQLINKDQKILAAWDTIEEMDPDVSTERLFAMVADATGYDAGDISEALYREHCRSILKKRGDKK
jgi:hypothetical protein